MRIAVLTLLSLLVALKSLGQRVEVRQRSWADTSVVFPRTGLTLHPLYETLHDKLAVSYDYSAWQGAEGVRLPQYGQSEQLHSVRATGSTKQAKWGAQGNAAYQYRQRAKVYGIAMAQPELFYPYISLDTSRRTLTREDYQLGGTLCYAWHDLGVGIGGNFAGTTQFGKKDPRPLARVGDFTTILALSYKLPYYVMAAQGDFRYYTESFSLNNEQEDRQDYVYYHLGLGLYEHDLSVQKRSESIKYIFAEYACTLQAAPLHRYWPFVQLAYKRNNAFGRTIVYTKVAETKQNELQTKLFFPITFASQQLVFGLYFDYAQRTGYEIDYYSHQVNTSPNITEEREYHRVAAWLGTQSNYKASIAYQYTMPSALFYVAYEGGLAALHTKHRKYHFEQQRLLQELQLFYQRFYARYDWSIALWSSWAQPLSNRTLWAHEARFLAQLQNSIERYYSEPHYALRLTLEGGFRITPTQRVAIALTGGYERVKSSHTAWLCELGLRYGFLSMR